MNKIRIKKGDTVKMLCGKDRGKSGVVERVFADSRRAIVKGIHIQKKHVKPSKKNPRGGIMDINKKIDISDMMLICPSCGKLTRIGFMIDKESKIRICKKCSKSVEVKAVS